MQCHRAAAALVERKLRAGGWRRRPPRQHSMCIWRERLVLDAFGLSARRAEAPASDVITESSGDAIGNLSDNVPADAAAAQARVALFQGSA